ncbi:CATRA conflict system CASPASE/TPR repeat-associated protein [Streptomyces abyssomicinicus]|uniref:CATRA conflict system CASPASE/TPR repeat-associated protein n=1 Tax=Streptomyces abyssomicinicus TaxID=574929 RepID=UPI00124F83F1|nr:CATRA conflict system CASPASE/TPR repeat-associated protein [Streptomyces abyssomicinicus]
MSSDPRFAREALQLHYFFAVQRLGGRGNGGPLLSLLWESCAQAGMNATPQPGGDLSLPLDLAEGPGFLSLRQRTDPAGTRQAMLYRLHDTIGLTVMLAADEGPGRTAAESAQVLHALGQSWDRSRSRAAATLGQDGSGDLSLLGTVRVHRSLIRPGTAALPAEFALAGEALRQELSPASRLSRPVETENGIALWEIIEPGAGFHTDRVLLLTTESTDEQEGQLDDWSWSAAHDGLVPLTRYLINATLIRDQYRVRAENGARLNDRLRRLRQHGEELTRDWQRLTADTATRPHTSRRDLARWESIATQAQAVLAEERLAGATTTDLRAMARTVEIAAAKMRALGTDADGRPRTLDSDEEFRTRLPEVLDDDLTYLAIAREQVTEAARVATESSAQRLQSHQQYLTLIQTTVIGALLMTLTAVQALEYKLPLPGRLHAPLIALLGSLGLGLPLMVLRRWRAGTGGRMSGTLELVSLTAIGAAAGWLAGSITGHTTVGVLTGTVLLVAAGLWLTRRPGH